MKPMLANSYNPKKVSFPALISPKLDGIRCLAELTKDGFKLWSRDEKPILSMSHIVFQLNKLATSLKLPVGLIFDGELYTRQYSFQVLNGTCRRQYFDERALCVNFYLFDVARHPDNLHTQDYPERYRYLKNLSVEKYCLNYAVENDFDIPTDVQTQLGHLHPWLIEHLDTNVRVLTHQSVTSTDEISKYERAFVSAGLEGAMVRTHILGKGNIFRPAGYETEASGHTRRSWGLQKVKSFEDSEFRIMDIFEEHDLAGNPKGRAAGFIMLNDNGSGKTFQCSGLTDAMKAEVWASPSQYIGQLATVKYFGRSDDGTPRHPNYKSLRPESEVEPEQRGETAA